jgi:hypothetical protein
MSLFYRGSYIGSRQILIIVTKDDLFYWIDIEDENIPSFIINDDKQVINHMIVKEFCHKQINDIEISSWGEYCFARNKYHVYRYNILNGVMKEYISQELIIDMRCGYEHSILLTQSGKVYEWNEEDDEDTSEEKISDEGEDGQLQNIIDLKEPENSEYEVNGDKRKKREKYIHFKLKSFINSSFQNEKIKMISCGAFHSLALTESGRVFGWGNNIFGQLGVDVEHSSEPIIIELNDLKIKKISCGYNHSLLLSCDGHIYAFGWNQYGQVGNGTQKLRQGFPIKLELNDKFIDIASHPHYAISMSQSIDYYVWGYFKGKAILRPEPTTYQSFEHILRAHNTIDNMKTYEKLIEFEDSFVKNGFYSEYFEEIEPLGSGSFGNVFKVKTKQDGASYESCSQIGIKYFPDLKDSKDINSLFKYSNKVVMDFKHFKDTDFNTDNLMIKAVNCLKDVINTYMTKDKIREEIRKYSAIKKIKFTSVVGKDEIIREYLNYNIVLRSYSENEYLLKHFDVWFEENPEGISLYILMELCDKTLDDVTKEFDKDSHLKINGTLTPVGYYIASQIFIQILQGVNHLHTRNPPLIHRDLKPANILLKKDKEKGFCVKIADFGLIAIHEFFGQSHTSDRGDRTCMAPEAKDRHYDIKADIYSLGVIFENLFALQSIE